MCGAKARRVDETLEVTRHDALHACGPLARMLPFRAMAIGHVVLAITAQELAAARAHERVHVRQYERWGIFFFPAYAASGLWQLLHGRSAYWDNAFEVEARRACVHPLLQPTRRDESGHPAGD